MKSLMSFVENEVHFEIGRIFSLVKKIIIFSKLISFQRLRKSEIFEEKIKF